MNALTEKLEALIETQAMGLAEQHLQAGHAAVEQIRQQTEARLAQRREGEELRFQQEAAQLCRQLLQGAKLRVDADLDRLRWALVQEVLSGVRARLAHVPSEPARYAEFAHGVEPVRYRAALVRLIAEAAQAIPDARLVVEMSARDAEWLRADWQQLAHEAAPGRELVLRVLDAPCLGGVRVCDEANQRRIDHTFEARLARMEGELLSAIMQTLFAEEHGGNKSDSATLDETA